MCGWCPFISSLTLVPLRQTGYIDGCFSDRSQNMSFPGVSGQVMADYNEGHYEVRGCGWRPAQGICVVVTHLFPLLLFFSKVLASLQTQIPGVLIANNDPDSRIEGYMIEGYRNDAASLHLLLDAVRQGRIVEVRENGGRRTVRNDVNAPCHCSGPRRLLRRGARLELHQH